jgi:hypothetical protein
MNGSESMDCVDGVDKETGDMKEQGQSFCCENMISIFY